MNKSMEDSSQSEMMNYEKNIDNCVFKCVNCQEIPEFTFNHSGIIKVICKNATPDHIKMLNNEINNLTKEESKKNFDNIMKKFCRFLVLSDDDRNNNVKENDDNGINFRKLNEKDINELKKYKLICLEHELPFKYYCNECKKHQCKECRFVDLSKEKCKHKNCVDFTQIECDIKDKIKEIKEKINSSNLNNKSINEDKEEDKTIEKVDNFSNYKEFVNILINHYTIARHYNIIKSILNLYNMLSRGKKKILYEMDRTKVFSPFILDSEETEKITEIKFSDYCVNMNIFKPNFTFSNLIKLSLKNNNISDISILAKYDFENLLIINLNANQLNDDMINIIGQINAPHLTYLNLSYNFFKDFKLFKEVEHFKSLEIFKLEYNPFNEEVDINTINEEYNFISMKKLYLSKGIFCNKTIGLLKKFKFGKLEILDISYNNIESLEFLKHLQFINKENGIPLKEIYLNNCDISDNELGCLKDFPNLVKIEFGNNLIKKVII